MPNLSAYKDPEGVVVQICASELRSFGETPSEVHAGLSQHLGFNTVAEFLAANENRVMACATPSVAEEELGGVDSYTGT